MTRTTISLAALAFAALLANAPAATADEHASTAGWTTVAGGPGTGCATDATPYEFYVRAADTRRVAIHFQGGGACWNARNCGLDGQKTFEASVDDGDRPWLATNASGIFELGNPRNPLHGFTVVLAPYCTADIHLGLRTGRFENGGGKRLDVHHRGLANAQRIIDWVRKQYADPELVVVTGGSAGAIASPVFASKLARHYPQARVVQLGDAAGGYRSGRLAPQLEHWGATTALKHDLLFSDLDAASANFENFYARAAKLTNLQLAQVNSIEDRIQLYFLAELGHEVSSLAPLLSGNIAELRLSDPKFRTYTMPGFVHEILRRPELYTTKVDDVELTTWLDDLIHGRRVGNVGDALLQAPADRMQ